MRPKFKVSIESRPWRPLSDWTPMKRKTPKRTGIGMRPSSGVISVERPMASPISTGVTRCGVVANQFNELCILALELCFEIQGDHGGHAPGLG